MPRQYPCHCRCGKHPDRLLETPSTWPCCGQGIRLSSLSAVSVHAWHPAQYPGKEEGEEKTMTASGFSQRPVFESLEGGTFLCLAGQLSPSGNSIRATLHNASWFHSAGLRHDPAQKRFEMTSKNVVALIRYAISYIWQKLSYPA